MSRPFAAAMFFGKRYNQNHDPDNGEFTSGDGGGSGGSVAPTESIPVAATKMDHAPALNAKAIDVAGDAWNRETAVRLETEYQSARPAIDKIVDAAIDEDVDFHSGVPENWDNLSGSQQEQAKEHFVDYYKGEYYDSEVNSWMENGEALHVAKHELADNFSDSEPSWAADAIADVRDEHDIPYTEAQLMAAISIKYTDEDYDGKGDPEIEFDDSKLNEPTDFNPLFTKDQLALPGIDAPTAKEPHEALTPEMRSALVDALTEAFNDQAEKDQSDVQPPDYLMDSAKEYLDQEWDEKSDEDKFEYAKKVGDIVPEQGESSKDTGPVAIPQTFDPLQQLGGSDYTRTQRLASYVSLERQIQLLHERLPDRFGEKPFDTVKSEIKRIDNELWSGWKDSSTNFAGSILQLAASKELRGRFRDLQTNSTDLIKQANDKYRRIGGFEGIKALVRAKWETTQYLLDKAGIHTVEVYRGLKIPLDAPIEKVSYTAVDGNPRTFDRVPDAKIVRNGAMSTTTSLDVANQWNAGIGTKVVLRIDTPRTSVLSVPAYGINVHGEKEVVIAGTAWKAWDAWKDRAPAFNQVPLKAAA